MNTSVSRDQIRIPKPLLVHAPYDGGHLLQRVYRPDIVPSGKLVDVAVQVLLADLVEGPLVRPFEHSPEGLNAVHVHRIPDVLCGTVVDCIAPVTALYGPI